MGEQIQIALKNTITFLEVFEELSENERTSISANLRSNLIEQKWMETADKLSNIAKNTLKEMKKEILDKDEHIRGLTIELADLKSNAGTTNENKEMTQKMKEMINIMNKEIGDKDENIKSLKNKIATHEKNGK